jgi:hypothetical protein
MARLLIAARPGHEMAGPPEEGGFTVALLGEPAVVHGEGGSWGVDYEGMLVPQSRAKHGTRR